MGITAAHAVYSDHQWSPIYNGCIWQNGPSWALFWGTWWLNMPYSSRPCDGIFQLYCCRNVTLISLPQTLTIVQSRWYLRAVDDRSILFFTLSCWRESGKLSLLRSLMWIDPTSPRSSMPTLTSDGLTIVVDKHESHVWYHQHCVSHVWRRRWRNSGDHDGRPLAVTLRYEAQELHFLVVSWTLYLIFRGWMMTIRLLMFEHAIGKKGWFVDLVVDST